MFTGLIQTIGKIQRQGNGLEVQVREGFPSLKIGDSIAVDGVCLTASVLTKAGFLADVSEETFSRTTLGEKANQHGLVNLEPALRLSDRLGGHLVGGHVDGLGEIVEVKSMQNSWHLETRLYEPDFGKYICKKGSIALNGISLTIAGSSYEGDLFWMSVIPHTWEATTLKYLKAGEKVNLEFDLMAKYAESLMIKNTQNVKELMNSKNETITEEWLNKQGWY